MKPSSLVLWAALAATLAATWYAAGIESPAPSDETVGVPERAARPLPTGVVPAPVITGEAVAVAAPAAATTSQGERMAPPREPLMAPRGWLPPAPPPPAAVAAPPPTAPPLPYRYLGRLEGGEGGTTIFLAEASNPGARPLAVRAGERFAQYQVDGISARGMTLTYLPLNQKQQLLFGNTP
ncbi:MAG: hypothetical protein GTN84_07945 [Hydrogenophaga sp.]|uniref:hypothetical protein n=1 Tax=Hydrogenophaga sp. TaxID=1904254 RepID=UPI0016BAC185|nr:hypothetical protein [Hydrogenophaga sp.]NIM40985.1 hypothetical protein [Hydrogenophaga sp.]NIN26343.1 hypothetical protein [Hydrogenophaga sp.]NIN31218.1 hypothetical protein [Hydrogenophaga sp.]NIN55257.1 hypothetical protein [Hydrogenophaga sp.]NIO53641.1 hypothetical protein [Hydrogenophaga sp.]